MNTPLKALSAPLNAVKTITLVTMYVMMCTLCLIAHPAQAQPKESTGSTGCQALAEQSVEAWYQVVVLDDEQLNSLIKGAMRGLSQNQKGYAALYKDNLIQALSRGLLKEIGLQKAQKNSKECAQSVSEAELMSFFDVRATLKDGGSGLATSVGIFAGSSVLVGGAIGAYAVLTTGLIGTALAGGAAGVATGAVTGPGAIAIGGVGIISGGAYYWWNKKKNDQIANTYMLKLRGDLVNHQAELKARLTKRLTQPLTSP